jgi:hypothetical protein
MIWLLLAVVAVLLAVVVKAVASWRNYQNHSLKTASGWIHSESSTRAELLTYEIRRLEAELGIGPKPEPRGVDPQTGLWLAPDYAFAAEWVQLEPKRGEPVRWMPVGWTYEPIQVEATAFGQVKPVHLPGGVPYISNIQAPTVAELNAGFYLDDTETAVGSVSSWPVVQGQVTSDTLDLPPDYDG